MKSIYAVLLCLLCVVPGILFAQQNNEVAQYFNNKFPQSDTLTSSYSGFVHTNWTQAGIGINIKRVLLMWNRTVLPVLKNFDANRTMDEVTSTDYKVNYRYDTIMIGYILRMGRNFYPYAGTGTAIRTDYVEVTDSSELPDVFTVKGKEASFATGVVGAIYTMPHHITLEASLQINPLLPFVGVGIRL